MPDIIKRLPPQVANLIAAGEVVERPASVVKELCENAIDAGACNITIEINHGGLTYIRVTDDGSGMSASDAETAFLRHATSKISTGRDLEAIMTRGFRGEALAAVGAVSRVQLLTREKGQLEGTGLRLDAGTVVEKGPAGCPEGTTIIVRDLFYNTPARMKYMKKDVYEAAACITEVHYQALSRPDISFTFIKDGTRALKTAGDSNLKNGIYGTLGREFALGLVPAEATGEGISVTGFVTKPLSSRGNRTAQYFFVNGRPIRSRSLSAALEEGYRNILMKGSFPGCVLDIEVKPSAVDVNVHPSKAEVKFASDKEIYRLVYHAAIAAVGAKDSPPTFSRGPDTQMPDMQATTGGSASLRPSEMVAQNSHRPMTERGYREYLAMLESMKAKPEPVSPVGAGPEQIVLEPVEYTMADSPQPKEETSPAERKIEAWRVVGEAMGTYILVETPEDLLIIDKHAAHERILFEKFRSRDMKVMSQGLLSPTVYSGGKKECAVLLSNISLLAEIGFEIEEFGAGAVLIRTAPSDVDPEDAGVFLDSISESIMTGKTGEFDTMRDNLLHMMACKAAVKGGDITDKAELERLVEQVITRSDIRYCPHGRPVSMSLGKKILDRHFRRT